MSLFFSEIFGVEKSKLDAYGAFDVSLVTDLPLFIDPFLLFDSQDNKYEEWHKELIEYLKFLKNKSRSGSLNKATIDYYYRFPEVKQNWLGFTAFSNEGRGLGPVFARALNENLSELFEDFGEEQITQGSHIEKLCLIKDRVGKDSISDFTTNVIKRYLLEYTEKFATNNIDPSLLKQKSVRRAYFKFDTGVWMPKTYTLPYYNDDFVILTPRDILTKDEAWINRNDLYGDFEDIPPTIENEELRYGVSKYFYSLIAEDSTSEERKKAAARTVIKFPEVIDYYIRFKENTAEYAHDYSEIKVDKTNKIFREILPELTSGLRNISDFEKIPSSYEESLKKIAAFKYYIENNDGYRAVQAALKVTRTEEVIQLFFGLAWLESSYDVNREVNNGRGPVDFKISMGSEDKSVIEFKLASNSALEKNLKKQAEIYGAANKTENIIKVIIVSNAKEAKNVDRILTKLGRKDNKSVVVIDARPDNKPSASTA